MMCVPGLYVSGPSRSGTTLLAAVLDAHSGVHMGYELIPPARLEVLRLARLIETVTSAGAPWPRAVGNRVREQSTSEIGRFVKRTARAGADADSLVATLTRFAAEVTPVVGGPPDRVALARAIVRAHAPPGTIWTGFKAGGPELREALALAPGSRVIAIIRDPRDVVVSQIERGMSPDAPTAAKRWNAHLRNLEALDERAVLRVRYEDLVTTPVATLDRLCERLGIPAEEAMLRFSEAGVGVLATGQRHVNDAALRRGFFSDSVGRWRGQLSRAATKAVERRCGDRMAEYGYELTSPTRIGRRD
jgi:hypothetical protein